MSLGTLESSNPLSTLPSHNCGIIYPGKRSGCAPLDDPQHDDADHEYPMDEYTDHLHTGDSHADHGTGCDHWSVSDRRPVPDRQKLMSTKTRVRKRRPTSDNRKPKTCYRLMRSCGHTEVLQLDRPPTDYLIAVTKTFPCPQCLPRKTQELDGG